MQGLWEGSGLKYEQTLVPAEASTAFHLQATLKRYQAEHRSKLDSLEKSQAELKKIRRKSQGARNALKYEHKEMEVNLLVMVSFLPLLMTFTA